MLRSLSSGLVRKCFIVLTLALGLAVVGSLNPNRSVKATVCCGTCEQIWGNCNDSCEYSFFACLDEAALLPVWRQSLGYFQCNERFDLCLRNCITPFTNCESNCDSGC